MSIRAIRAHGRQPVLEEHDDKAILAMDIGYDWLGAINVFIGTLWLTSDSPSARAAGFLSMMFGNVFFFLFGQQIGSQAIMLSSIVFFPLNLWGLIRNLLYIKAGK